MTQFNRFNHRVNTAIISTSQATNSILKKLKSLWLEGPKFSLANLALITWNWIKFWRLVRPICYLQSLSLVKTVREKKNPINLKQGVSWPTCKMSIKSITTVSKERPLQWKWGFKQLIKPDCLEIVKMQLRFIKDNSPPSKFAVRLVRLQI